MRKKIIKNRPWKEWRTRKTTFLYMLIVGTGAIVAGGVLQAKGQDSSSWLGETLNFCKFVVGTGTTIILADSVDGIIKAIKNESESEE